MPKNTPIAAVMTTRLCTADVSDTLETVRAVMLRGSFHHVPILDGRKLVGIISSRDLVQVYRQGRRGDGGGARANASVATTMKTDLVTLRTDDSVEKALDLLADGAIHSVLVLDAEDELAGIATNFDLLEYLLA